MRLRISAPTRPRSLLAASVIGLFGVVGILLAGSLVSCQIDGGPSAGGGQDSRAATANSAVPGTTSSRLSGGLQTLTSEPLIRVRIAAGVDTVRLNSIPAGALTANLQQAPPGPVWIAVADPSPTGQWGTQPTRLTGPVAVTLVAEAWVVTDPGGKIQRFDRTGELQIVASAPDAAPRPRAAVPLVILGDAAYNGILRLSARSDLPGGAFDIIEHIPVEAYLCGVVAKEMYVNWPPAAYQVQAVCARTYALHERQRALIGRKSYDVESSTRDQAYNGATQNKAAGDAVASTRGVILTDNGAILRAYYSSTCGGRTGAARDTWPTSAGYEFNLAAPIQEHHREFLCFDAPLFTWQVERPRDDLIKRFRAYGQANGMLLRRIDGLASVQVLQTNGDGRPSEYKVIEPGGRWFKLRAEDLRLACNYPAPGVAEVTSKTRVNSGDVEFIIPRVLASAAGATITVKGRGYGHGVGMCQYCARNMALRGDDWRKMLATFYPGAQVTKTYP
jgi:stage II sporulation protein D